MKGNIVFGLLLVSLVSCAIGKIKSQDVIEGRQPDEAEKQVWEYNNIPKLEEGCDIGSFPIAAYNPAPDGSIRSVFTGTVVDNSFQKGEFKIFDSRLIVQVKADYVLYNTNHETAFYVMVFDFKKELSDGMAVVPNDIIGRVENSAAKIMVFSDTLDPYMVLGADSPPVFYAGYFWFSPSLLSSGGTTKYLNFDPMDDIDAELREIGDHITKEDPGFVLYDRQMRFLTKLTRYPREISGEEKAMISTFERIIYGGNGINTHITEINAGGYDYLLCWQRGFSGYLEREYDLNSDIWLYGIVVTYDVWNEKGYIFLRDFSQESLEEKYVNRLIRLKG
jgi:hypothetical protein